MTTTRSDAFVFFGATGDLAYKKIFPALQSRPARPLGGDRLPQDGGPLAPAPRRPLSIPAGRVHPERALLLADSAAAPSP
jgi:hypothetical protein